MILINAAYLSTNQADPPPLKNVSRMPRCSVEKNSFQPIASPENSVGIVGGETKQDVPTCILRISTPGATMEMKYFFSP